MSGKNIINKIYNKANDLRKSMYAYSPEPVFLNFYGAQESILRNRFRQPMNPGGPVRQTYSYSVPSPHG